MLSKFLFFLYGILWDAFYLMAGVMSFFSEKARRYVRNPAQIAKHIAGLQEIAAKNPRRVFIYCSSAGEYEQALPIAMRLIDQGWFVHFGFFSFSGSYYAHKRKDQHSYFQHLTDHPRFWKKVFAALKPQITLVVRHELWPAFVRRASAVSVLGIVDLSRPKSALSVDKSNAGILKRLGVGLHRWMLAKFSRLYCVSQKDCDFFTSFFAPEKLRVVGDTKYDRVWERSNGALKSPEAKDQLEDVLRWVRENLGTPEVLEAVGEINKTESVAKRKLLVVGSAWPEDLDLILRATRLIPHFWSEANLLVVPHDIRKSSVDGMIGLLAEFGVGAHVFLPTHYELDAAPPAVENSVTPSALILNSMGYLAECYRLADGVWVGGAVAGKIHNVLEPAVFLKNIAHGSNFHSQVEAVQMVERGLSTVVECPEDFVRWWKQICKADEKTDTVHANLREFMFKNLGASKRIVDDILLTVDSE